MSEGSISQAEIDALLSGVDIGGLGGGSVSSSPIASFDIPTLQSFSEKIKDKLSGVIASMTESSVEVATPTVEACGRDQLLAKIPEVPIAVMADYSTGLSGDHLFLLSAEFATKLVSLINKEENPSLDDMALSVISEVIASHSGAEITELSSGGKLPGLATNPPEAVNQPKAMVRMPQGTFALFTYPVTLAGEAFTLWEAVSSPVAEGMVTALGGGSQPAAPAGGFNAQSLGAAPASPAMASPMGGQMGGMNMGGMGMQQMGGMNMGGGMQQMGGMNMGGMGMGMPMQQMGMGQMGGMMGGMMQPPPNVQSLSFPNLQTAGGAGEQGNISLIMDVNMEMTVELGRTKKTIKEILGMGEGTIIELDKLAGEPVDILVNHKPIAKGEVVVIDENFGVRVTEILPAIEHVAASI